jgi:hypothetical protein
MDEARRLLARLERIDALAGDDRRSESLLPELRALVAEAEAWARREDGAGASAGSAIEALRQAVARTPTVARTPPVDRTVPAGEPAPDGMAPSPLPAA